MYLTSIPKSGKKIINTFIGGLHQITYKRRFGNYTDKQEIAIALTNEYTENGLKAYLEPDLYEELYFISVKYFKAEKEIGKYDIGKLCSLIKEHEKIGRIIKVYIFVKDKNKAIEKFNAQHSSSNILINYINPGGNYEHIYDATDLHEAYFKLKKLLAQYNYLKEPSNITDFETYYLKVLKSIFIPRFHQQLFIEKIHELITNKKKNISSETHSWYFLPGPIINQLQIPVHFFDPWVLLLLPNLK